jgi:hypothetical protein
MRVTSHVRESPVRRGVAAPRIPSRSRRRRADPSVTGRFTAHAPGLSAWRAGRCARDSPARPGNAVGVPLAVIEDIIDASAAAPAIEDPLPAGRAAGMSARTLLAGLMLPNRVVSGSTRRQPPQDPAAQLASPGARWPVTCWVWEAKGHCLPGGGHLGVGQRVRARFEPGRTRRPAAGTAEGRREWGTPKRSPCGSDRMWSGR